MGYTEFKTQFKALIAINRPDVLKEGELTEATELGRVDSLTLTEMCVLSEVEVGISVDFGEVREFKTYGDWMDLLADKGFGP